MNHEQYQKFVEHSPSMGWCSETDPSGARVYFNPAWLAFTGRALNCERGWGWLDGVHPDDLEAVRTAYQESSARRETCRLVYRLRRHDGQYRRLVDQSNPYPDAAGDFAGLIGTAVDATDLEFEYPFAGARDFFDMSLDNLCVAGLDGYLRWVNPAWTRTLGWSVEELTSRPLIEFVHPEDRAATLASREGLRVGVPLYTFANRYLCKDGSFRWFEWRSAADVGRGFVYATARDITHQKEQEAQLERAKELQGQLERQLLFADRMASVGTLAAGVAHEINNPLGFVAANTALMLESLEEFATDPDPSRTQELIEMALEVRDGAERIRKIVRGLQTFSRCAEERLTTVEVRPVLELAIDMAMNEIRHRARLVTDFGPSPAVLADQARLSQVFINLLVNAAQAIPEGERDANEIRVATSTDGTGQAVIEVRDSGLGIPQDLLERVFDPFFTTKAVGVGTGLGLSICHNIIASLGGEITVDSVVGRGTTFRVTLKPAIAPVDAMTRAASAAAPANGSARILVIDDEPAIGNVLRRILREHDVTVLTAARDALTLLESGSHFDLVISDLMMPEMSGMDLHHEVSHRFAGVAERFVFVSGGAFTPAAAEFLERVPNPKLAKPFEPSRVRALVQELLSA